LKSEEKEDKQIRKPRKQLVGTNLIKKFLRRVMEKTVKTLR